LSDQERDGVVRERLLRIENLSKAFGVTVVLDAVSLEIRKGEIHGLVGQNGSGKSTLIKCLSGFHSPDSDWTLTIGDDSVSRPLRPGEIRDLGVSFVHQDLGVLPDLSVLENLMLPRIARDKRLFIPWRKERRHAEEMFKLFGLDLNPRTQFSQLSPVEQAQIAVIRAVLELRQNASRIKGHPGVLVLDEATTFLDQAGRQSLYKLLRNIVASGVGVLFVSHDVDEVLKLTDRISVMRDGKLVETVSSAEVSHDEIIGLIIGGDRSLRLNSVLSEEITPETTVSEHMAGPTHDGAPAKSIDSLRVSGLCGPQIENVGFAAKSGEIIGITGIVGSGWEVILQYIYGARRADRGTLTIDDQEFALSGLSPTTAVQLGMVFVPSNRLTQGIVGELSVQENVMLPVLSQTFHRGRIQLAKVMARCAELLEKNNVQPARPEMQIGLLSGGNQQKAVIGKWLQLSPRVILLNEPTQGVDVGARQRIFATIRNAAAGGAIVLYASGDWEEVFNIAHRVIVVADGQECASLEGTELQLDRIAQFAYQGSRRSADLDQASLAWDTEIL
jgi:ribose transport system ATP-binding protein